MARTKTTARSSSQIAAAYAAKGAHIGLSLTQATAATMAGNPAPQMAQCIDGVLVLFDMQQKGLTGVLVDNKKQAVRCMGQETPQEVK
jgi:hypothetical protein